MPIDPAIKDAVDQVNSITPLAVHEHRVTVGTFNADTGEFQWALTETVTEPIPVEDATPPGSTGSGASAGPGPGTGGQPGSSGVTTHVAPVNSFNMVYEIPLATATPVQVTLEQDNGRRGRETVTAQTVQGKAIIAFHPHTTRYQTLRFRYAGHEKSFLLKPRLQAQLGAFVLPHMLLSIVYEPPGRNSSARYSSKSTVGTVVAVGSSLSNGIVKRVDGRAMADLVAQVAAGGADALAIPGLGTAIAILNAGLPETTLITTQTETTSNTESSGHFVSIAKGYETIPNDATGYPGNGDVFVVLTDVAFLYWVEEDLVHLGPIAYRHVRKWRASELEANGVPADLAEKFRSLDPHFRPAIMPRASTSRRGDGPGPPVDLAVPRFGPASYAVCDPGGAEDIEITEEDYQSTKVTHAQTVTRAYRMTGFLAQISPGSYESQETVTETTYSSSKEDIEIDVHAASIRLNSTDDEGSFEVAYYYDRIFRTFLTIKGPPLTTDAAIAGIVRDPRGQGLRGRRIMLKIGGETYQVTSGAGGAFAFRFPNMPRGQGKLTVDGRSMPIAYAGRPVRVDIDRHVVPMRPTPPHR